MEASAETRPRLCLSIGVTGHRNGRLEAAGADAEQLRPILQKLLMIAEKTLAQVWRTNGGILSAEPPSLRLVSPLAEGADQIAGEAALAQGWHLDACLPFTREIYSHDFRDKESGAAFQRMLASAHSIYELTGERHNEAAAYEAVGRVTLDQSDLLLAIWDGDLAQGRGGTAQIVAEAVAQRIPVIHVHPSGEEPPQLLWSGLNDFDLDQLLVESVPKAPAQEALGSVIRALTEPPTDKHNATMLARFLSGRVRRLNLGISYPLLLSAAGVRRPRRSDFVPATAAECAEELRTMMLPLLEARCQNPEAMELLGQRYGRADAAALDNAQLYRSGFVTNFALAALAVLLALSSLLLPDLKLPFITLELAVVLLILVNTRAGRRGGWHDRWMDNRHLAERLRCLSLMSLVGDLGLRDREERDAAALPGWVRWYSRATAREIGLLCVSADAEFLAGVRAAALQLLDRQIQYQSASGESSHRMEHRLGLAGEWLFGGTVVACGLWIGMKLLGMPMVIAGKVTLTELVTFLTAFLPALGAALYGIRMQGDFAGLAQRAHVTVARLQALARTLEREPLHHDKLAARLRRLADITLGDVDRWRSAFKSRPISLPG
jgi:hypothetical protein